jgi:hypothetical protein
MISFIQAGVMPPLTRMPSVPSMCRPSSDARGQGSFFGSTHHAESCGDRNAVGR